MNDLTSINQIPVGFPQMNIPLDNQFTLERWKLGKKLFYETKLSLDSSISCASCHKIEFAFSDNVSLSPGVFDAPGTRNAPTLTNIGFQPYFTKEGGIETLEKQVLIPIQEHNEMNFNILDAGKRLNEIDAFKKLSLETYNREMDYYVITRALACFERTIVSSNSKYDAFLKNNAILTSEELNGKNLFFGNKTNCSSCHSGILLTDFSLQNNGLYENYIDKGRYRLTLDTIDIGIFKVPTLRNVQFSSPYMHDGSMSTLKEVVEHYNEGGKNHINKSNLIKPLNLSEEEILDIVSFLETLSDFDFISNKNLKNE
ncbi:MAG: cytochrome c peroxidase [Planctomycetota bacterium]|jgi:cytochrome c peroxidase